MPVSDRLSDYEAFREASDWDDAVRYSDGNLPDLPPAEVLQQYRDAKETARYGWFVPLGVLALVMILGTLAYCSVAQAQQQACGPMDETDANFLKSYNEAVSGAGMGEKETEAWEVMVSPNGETFTIVRLYLAMKMACVVGSGRGWVQIPVPKFQEPRQKL